MEVGCAAILQNQELLKHLPDESSIYNVKHNLLNWQFQTNSPKKALLAGAVEYTNCITVMLELMWSNPSLPSLPGSLWPWVVAPDRFLSKGK